MGPDLPTPSGPSGGRIHEALARRAAAQDKLGRLLRQRCQLLRQSLLRSRSQTVAARLLQRLDALEAEVPVVPGGAAYLRLGRALSALEHELAAAEDELVLAQRRAREALIEAAQALAEAVPSLARVATFLPEVPIDPGMAQRMPALLALLRTRQRLVPLLLSLRRKT